MPLPPGDHDMHPFLPPELMGVWRREVITTPKGYRDETTKVLWLQTRTWYADLRVKADRPVKAGATGFADYDDAELIKLAAVQGFCGQLTAHGGVCLWRRDLDYQPPSGDLDEAKWAVKDDVMIEDGIHSDYQEIWRREPDTAAPLAAFELTQDPAGRTGLLVVAGDYFTEVVDRAAPLPKGKPLVELVTAELAAGRREAAIGHLSMRISHGRIAGGGGPWRVTLSSFPWLEGRSIWEGGGFDPVTGVLSRGTGAEAQRWAVIDTTLEPAALARHLALGAH
jgi:hypothetical protein